ncbi:MAG: Sodium/glucose cotransporter, partial [Pseudomonadota bacterium]
EAYPTMMQYLPSGLLGLVFAALMAAVVASTASKINSIATIFTLDLYAKFRGIDSKVEDHPGRSEREAHLVLVGRVTAAVATLLALIAARPLLGGSDQAFQFIQEFSGFFTPGITVIFLLGLFWKKASEAGAIGAAAASVILSYLFKVYLPDVPFMDRMGIVFLAALALAVVLSFAMPAAANADRISTEGVTYKTNGSFNFAAVAVVAILVALYATWW